MLVKQITEQEFYDYMKHYDGLYHFIHDEIYYDHVKTVLETFLLGLFKDDNLVGVAFLSAYPMMRKYRGFSTHFGPLLTEFNNEDFEFFLKEIDAFIKVHNGLEVTIAPNQIYQVRDKDGNVIEDDERNNREIMGVFERLGFKHHGFSTQLVFSEHLRFQSVVDITGTMEDVFKRMETKTRSDTRRALKQPIKIRHLTPDEYDEFLHIYKDTEERLGFDKVPRERILDQLRILDKKIYVVLAELNLEEVIETLEKEKSQLEDQNKKLLEEHDLEKASRKVRNVHKDTEIKIQQTKNQIKDAEERIEKYGTVIPLSSAMYYFNNNEMVYLYSGSLREHSKFLATNFVTIKMIEDAQKKGLKRFNMYGITGNFESDAADYGVFQFKRGFGAEIEELPGTFSKVYHPVVYKLGKLLNRV
ncbi:peptidoglycan bridge formation glycyltransferase FemA/FemB family protein [Phocicoccus schoeneichii]|uniref:peptidoglycan bridge formation glycyltransferase FemA/FemB family protein n=1 Tax=Phocicoccus schoeneichii TaxID=1812261 RepID=UPI003D0FF3BF